MNRRSFITILLTMLMSMTGTKAFAHDIAVANTDGITIFYKWINDKTELEVSFGGSYWGDYSNEYKGDIIIPGTITYDGNTYNVTRIGYRSFCECSLTSITIPNTVTTIDESAFASCTNLTSVTIPKSVFSIRDGAFLGTAWYNNQPDGLVYAGNVAYKFKGKMPVNNQITIKEGTVGIAERAFWGCSDMTSVKIPSSVISIGKEAFAGCYNLINIISEIDNPFEIGKDVFYSPSFSTDIYRAVTLVVPKKTKATYLSTAGWSGFEDIVETGEGGVVGKKVLVDDVCYTIGVNNTVSIISGNLKYFGDIVIPNQIVYNGKTYSVTSISGSAFYGCSGLSSVTIPNSIISIGQSAFSGCSGLKSIIIPSNVLSIGIECFKNCSGLASVNINSGVTSIEDNAFNGCSSLSSVIIPNSIRTIGYQAFKGCSSLNSVIIGSGVTSIGEDAFSSTNLRKAIWLTNTPPSGYKYVKGTVNYVSNDQFSSLSNTVKYQFLSSYFDVDGIRYVPVSPSERTCDAIDCVYDESAKDTKIASTVAYKGVTMNVKNINSYLAYANKYIETLSVDIEGMLANYAFADCSNLKSVLYGNKVTGLGNYVFSGCSSLTSVKTTDNIPQNNVLYISKNIIGIEDYAVLGCSKIKNVIMADSDSELKIGSNGKSPLFSSCPLDYVYIGRNINYWTNSNYGYSPFYRNTTLREVKITDKETEISDNEFYGCTNLQSVTIGDGVTAIGNWAFSGCQSLEFFAFGSHVKNIGQEAFSDCTSVTEITSKALTPPNCGIQALDDINKWECKLFVPQNCLANYQVADQWKDFFFVEESEPSSTLGDANGDGIVNDADIHEIENHIMGKTSSKFIFNNADANCDNVINVVDIVKIINIIKEKE